MVKSAMQPERWKEVEHLCQEALEREEDQRAAFMQSACAGDEALLREVQSLGPIRSKRITSLKLPHWNKPPRRWLRAIVIRTRQTRLPA